MRKLRFFIALLAVMLAVVYLSGYQMRFHDFNNITRALRLNIWWFTAGKKEYYRVVKVPFGTDREINIIENKQVVGLGRGGKLSLGRAEITVPKIHSIGQIERPTTWNPLNWLETRDKHFTLKTLEINDDSFKQLISEIAASSKSFENQALVFVHGYATSFEYALFRLAQMVYDLNFDGVPFLYSWPSAGGLSDYLGDEGSSEQSQAHFANFLRTILRESQPEFIHFVAHSMGSRPLLYTLREMKDTEFASRTKIGEVILAAPDIDVDVFRLLAPHILSKAKGGTIYASSTDKAMIAARNAAGYPRVGDVPPKGPPVVDKVDTIDVSSTSTDVFSSNHSSYAERSILLQDIKSLLLTSTRPPHKRSPILEVVGSGKQIYWRYPN